MSKFFTNVNAIVLFYIFGASSVGAEVNDFVCGSLANAYGPFDYRSDKTQLPVVDHFHFTPQVENLV